MCGILGYVGERPAAPLLIDGLRRLEYRGYDSAGVATLVNGVITCRRASGKLANLESRLRSNGISGTAGIGHTRWATHGAPSERNAHPHIAGRVAVVHNGIIENYRVLRGELANGDADLASETDTEVAAHIFNRLLDEGLSLEDATAELLSRLKGMFALVFLIGGEDAIVGARRGAPLAVGWGEGEMFLASDEVALADVARRVSYLEDGDYAIVRRDGADILDESDRHAERPIIVIRQPDVAVGKGNHRHFMHKEIHEQPVAVSEILGRYRDPTGSDVVLPGLDLDLAAVPRLSLIACGTAYYAALTGKYLIETIARLPVEADMASEFRYRRPPMPAGGAAVFVSQSGETADTLAALRYAREQDQAIIAITNTETSTMARESETVLPTHAGLEVGVAATKTFTCQLAVLMCMTVATARARGEWDAGQARRAAESLASLPALIARAMHLEDRCRAIAHDIAVARDVLYLGRGPFYVTAMEGALKLKEISYIHAEAYASGEMKHGPIALIDEHVPVITIAPGGELFEKTMSNVQEAAARNARIVLITDEDGAAAAPEFSDSTIVMPRVDSLIAPAVYAIPVQLIAYHAAVHKGTDVDQPRNLAKSVTVE